ncbi:MAG: methyl-accepting chemotaxis protein [Nitrospiraceae bacterium]|nr:methyl-accepting chemotaxis protein [Nitrospiraceae bacterium]
MRRSLSRSFILIVLMILIIGQGLLWVWFLQGQKKHYEKLLDEKIRLTALLLGSVSNAAITGNNYGYLENYIDALSTDNDILSVTITGRDGGIIRQKSFRPDTTDVSAVFRLLYLPAESTYDLPVVTSSGQNEGNIRIKYSGDHANLALERLITIAPIGQLLVFVLIIYAIYFFFQKKVGRPVEKLNARLGAITDGDLAVEIDPGEDNEIGGIGSGLKFLKESLARTIKKLNATSADVSRAITQLNGTFNSVKKGMEAQSNSIGEISTSLRIAAESQRKITAGTEQLAEFSTENVTSLLEVKATSEEIAASTDRLFQAVDDSYSAVAELSQTAKRIAESSQEALTSVEETSASVEEINASVREIERGAKDSTELAEKVRQVAAEEGVIVMTEAIDAMEKISEKVQSAVGMVTRLGARSKDIEGMLSVIKNVTEQTNLLSLNAAILAAQAGEYGKGFSVVADEIHALSERTAVSTKDIEGIVGTIHTEIKDVVSIIEETMDMMETGKQVFYKAGTSTGEIVTVAQNSASMAHSIQKATEEQARGLSQMTITIDRIRDMIYKMAHATEEQFKSSNYMLEKMSEVKEIAETTKKGTREQAVGTKHITGNLEIANDRIADINQSVQSQQKSNENIVQAVERIKSVGLSTLKDVEDVAHSISALHSEIIALTKEMETFRT